MRIFVILLSLLVSHSYAAALRAYGQIYSIYLILTTDSDVKYATIRTELGNREQMKQFCLG